jgi:8-oxo-dGTP pyrophosphatase MutT (NUDIX family)
METAAPALEKVTVFVTRGGPASGARELLVFRHPHAGVQLPAGTVEEGEPAEAAARRETWEETGLTDVAVVAHLGSRAEPLPSDLRAVLCRVTLLQYPAPDAPPVPSPPWFLGLRRGLFVRQISRRGDWAEVAYEEYDGPAHRAAGPTRAVAGWVPADAITPTVVRHFYHLTPTAPTPDAWVQSAEEWEHRFELFWVPLASDTATIVEDMNPTQAGWLAEHADRLR